MRCDRTLGWLALAVRCAASLLCAALGGAAAAADAQIALRVQARSQVTAEASFQGAGLLVSGLLSDDLGTPLDARALEIEASGGNVANVKTDARGRFEGLLAGVAQPTTLRIVFAGDAHHVGTRLERSVDPARAPVSLAIELASPRIDLDLPSHEVAVQASSAGELAGLAVTLRDERNAVLAEGRTDVRGRVAWRLRSHLLGSPGAARWRAVTRPDATHEEGHTELNVLRTADSQLTMRGRRATAEVARVEGRLSTRRAALPNRTVSLHVDGRPVADVQTDANGRFAAELAIDPRSATIEGRYVPEVEWLGASRSMPLTVGAQPTTNGPSPLWLLLALLCFAPALRALWKRRPPPEPPDRVTSSGGRVSGVRSSARRSLRGTSTGIGGRVLDDATERPLAEAQVRVRTGDGATHEAPLDQDARFECGPLPIGAAKLTVTAPGFVEVEYSLRIPHHGEASMLEVRLVGARSRILALFDEAARHVLPPTLPPHRMTPREVVSAARRPQRTDEPLEQLAEHVQRAAYGRPVPTPSEIGEVETAARRLIGAPHAPSHEPKHRR